MKKYKEIKNAREVNVEFYVSFLEKSCKKEIEDLFSKFEDLTKEYYESNNFSTIEEEKLNASLYKEFNKKIKERINLIDVYLFCN